MVAPQVFAFSMPMPPTRGHDLKRTPFRNSVPEREMPPTRGHDLKQAHERK